MSHVGDIPWTNPAIAIPAFLAMITIPLTASIATGLSLGFTAFALLKLVRGDVRREDWLVYLLAALFIAQVYTGLSAGRSLTGSKVVDAELDEVRRLVQHEMSHSIPLDVPLKVETKVGSNWGQLTVVEEDAEELLALEA